jgi:hypothetical protein
MHVHRHDCAMTRFEWLPTDVDFEEALAPESIRSDIEATRDMLAGPAPASALFTGASGTGKTRAARALAAHLGRPLARVRLRRLTAGYIGETEKNLTRFLESAAARNAIVLFDGVAVLERDPQVAEAVMRLANEYPGHVIFEGREPGDVPRGIADKVATTIEFLGPRIDVESLEGSMRRIYLPETGVTAFVGSASGGPVDDPVVVSSLGDAIGTFGPLDLAHPMSHAVAQFFEAGGRRAVIVRVPVRSGEPGALVSEADLAAPELEGSDLGLWALRSAAFDLLVVPPAGPGQELSAATRRAAAALCAESCAVYVADPPATWTSATAVDVADLGLVGHHGNVTVYWPPIEAPDGSQGTAAFGPAAAVAGVCARSDAEEGIWKAPAGPDALVPATGVAIDVTEDDVELLTSHGVNALKETPGGVAVWGARTLAAPEGGDWKYVSVRRLGLMLERTIGRGLAWVVFEPNDQATWSQIDLVVGAFLTDLWRRGAFQGSKAEEAFYVRSGRETTTESDLQRGIVNVVVGFAPLKPAEFVIIRIGQKTA